MRAKVRCEQEADVLTAHLDREVFNKGKPVSLMQLYEKTSPLKHFAGISYHLDQNSGLLSRLCFVLTMYTQMGNSPLQVFQKSLHFNL